MKHSIFTIYDSKAQAFLQPFFSVNLATAARACADVVADPATPFNKHPEDYVTFQIGHFDDLTGEITPTNVPVNLGPLSALTAPPEA